MLRLTQPPTMGWKAPRGRDTEGACAASRAAAFRSPSRASWLPSRPAPSRNSRSATACFIRNSATATSPPSTATSSPSNSTRPARSGWWIVSWSGYESGASPNFSSAQLKHHQRREHDAAAERLQRREHLAEEERAADRGEQRLEIHEQRGAERPDARGRGEDADEPGGDCEAQGHEREPASRGRGRLPVCRRERGDDEHDRRGEQRVPGDAQRVGAGKQRARREQHDDAAERGAKRGEDPPDRERGRMRADHQREADKSGDRGRGAAPGDYLEPARRGREPGEQRIDEIGQDRDRHLDRLERLEQEKHVAGKKHAEAERDPFGARSKGAGRRNEAQPRKQHGQPEYGAHDRDGERIGAGIERDLAQHVRAGERGGPEQRRADLRQPAAGLRGGELRHNGRARWPERVRLTRKGSSAALRLPARALNAPESALGAVRATSRGRRRGPGPASAVTRAGERIWLAKSTEPRERCLALLHRVEAAIDAAMAGAEIRAPASVRARRGRGER